jgi:hypothetical protein
MGWIWDHAVGDGMRSYNAHDNLGLHLMQIAPRRHWQAIATLFFRADSNPFTIPANDVPRIATAFTNLAPLAAPTWQRPVRELAASARSAARNNSTWNWR